MHLRPLARAAILFVALLLAPGCAAGLRPAHGPQSADRIDFTQQTLPNGLRVIYVPLRQAPVVHVRVLYHVGSRDERPDRQGFAHMFEHMMFRGSAHVRPEEHMKLVGMVGGYSNAFTSFDQTVYVNTVPANHLEMTLYLEADRMASFRVSREIYEIERRVVMEEWRRRINSPYGTFFDDFFALAFTTHPYRWTPIGNMDHLQAAGVEELQEFFNRYYVPNNAVLVIAGDIDVGAARGMVDRYFSWIPRGAPIQRDIPAEPPVTQPRRQTLQRAVPLPRVGIAFHTPPYRADDNYALALLSTILGGGRSSRLDQRLVTGDDPMCVTVSSSNIALHDAGLFSIGATLIQGRDPQAVEDRLFDAIRQVVEHGVTAEELQKAKTIQRVAFIRGRQTAEDLAEQIGHETLIGGDPERVNTAMRRLEAVTAADVQDVARRYLRPSGAIVQWYVPGEPPQTRAAASQPSSGDDSAAAAPLRQVRFPPDYPTRPPINQTTLAASFARGTESFINGVRVIVMPDRRLPQVHWSLTMRRGSDSDPPGKEGLASLTAELLRRGAAKLSYNQLNEDLESRGITITITDGGDYTRLSGSSLTENVEHGILRSRQILLEPTLAEDEFNRLKTQTLSSLKLAQARPETAASQTLARAIFGDSPLGRFATPASVASITLEEVRACYRRLYRPNDAILVISGDVDVQRGRLLAEQLLEGWEAGALPDVDYSAPPEPRDLRIIVVDRPEAAGALIRMAAPAYDIHSDEKFAGSLASSILSSGIDSRLGRHVRAERGLVYSVWGYFQPRRQAGQFLAGAETDLTTAADTVAAMFDVFRQMAAGGISADEEREAKLRTVGGMVMGMQTIQSQAGYRVDGILNDYPIDYFDRYPQRIEAVTAEQIAQVVDRYVRPQRMVVVVVAPAQAVCQQLSRLGEVQVVPMPSPQ